MFICSCLIAVIHPQKMQVALALLQVGKDFVGRCSWAHVITGAHCIFLERKARRIEGAKYDRQELLQ